MTSKAFELAKLGNAYSDGALSNRNLIINGAMQVAQRGTSATGLTAAGYRTCDRWYVGINSIGTWTVTQEEDGPSGFKNSLKLECTTADAAPTGSDFLFIRQGIEAQNTVMLGFGTADAKDITVSFWVKSNVTGTYTFNMQGDDPVRHYSTNYTVSSSGTWEYKTITISGDTVAGSTTPDNTTGYFLEWWFGSGSNYNSGAVSNAWEASDNTSRNAGSNVNLAGTIGNYFQITGVSLEVGDTATPFEHRSYGQELALCQRYYENWTGSKAMHPQYSSEATGAYAAAREVWSDFKSTKRSSPSVSVSGSHSPTSASIGVHGFASQSSQASATASLRITYWEADAEL